MNRISKKLYEFASSLVTNRPFDLYLKALGIQATLLNPGTLVPIALVLGKDAFEEYLTKHPVPTTSPGQKPHLKDPLVMSYLKLAGTASLLLEPSTMIPIGILAFVYELYERKELGNKGDITMYLKRVYGNRVIDLFLKYRGLLTLTTKTLVPMSLLLSAELLESELKGETPQQGGAKTRIGHLIQKKIPLIETDPLLSEYLKLLGLTSVALVDVHTMVPLGLLMMIYHLYEESNFKPV